MSSFYVKITYLLYVTEEEKEITLFKNTPLTLERLFVNNNEYNVSYLKDKVFKA